MNDLSIVEMLDIINPRDYIKDKAGVEYKALQFWTTNMGKRLPNNKLLTRKLVAERHGFSAGRMSAIIKDPLCIGRVAGQPLRIPFKIELQIVAWIGQRCQARLPTTMDQILEKGNRIITIYNHFALKTRRGPLTESWYYEFYKRHNNQLSRRRVEGLDISRINGRSTARVIEYFSCLRDLMETHKFKQSQIFNLDETPCPISNIPRYSVWIKQLKDAHIMQPDNRLVLTMMACVASNGSALPPLIIFKGKTVDINYMSDNLEVLVASNESAYMTKELFASWVVKFVELSAPTPQSPVLLIMDNFVGHLDYAAFEYMRSHHVYVAGLQAHTSDLTKPLDLSVFGPYKKEYRQQYRTLNGKSTIIGIEQRDVVNIMSGAYKKSFNSRNITNGFAKAGIVPFAPLNVLEQCEDWNKEIYDKYVPNDRMSETPWTKMRDDPNINGSNQAQEVIEEEVQDPVEFVEGSLN